MLSLAFDEYENQNIVSLGLYCRFALYSGYFSQNCISLEQYIGRRGSVELFDRIIVTLDSKGFGLEKCIEFSTDGASIMCEVQKGVAKLMTDAINYRGEGKNR